MNTLNLLLVVIIFFYTSTTLAHDIKPLDSDPIIITECSTEQTCTFSNIKELLVSPNSAITNYLIKNTINNKVFHYTAEFNTAIKGGQRYLVKYKSEVNVDLAEAVGNYLTMTKRPYEGGLNNLGYQQVAFYNGIGFIYENTEKPFKLNELIWRKAQMAQAIADDQANKNINKKLISAIKNNNIIGTFVNNSDYLKVFSIKESLSVFVFKNIKSGTFLTIEPMSIVLLDNENMQLIEIKFDGHKPNWQSINGQFIEINDTTQTLWLNSFLASYLNLKDCSKLGCKIVLKKG